MYEQPPTEATHARLGIYSSTGRFIFSSTELRSLIPYIIRVARDNGFYCYELEPLRDPLFPPEHFQ